MYSSIVTFFMIVLYLSSGVCTERLRLVQFYSAKISEISTEKYIAADRIISEKRQEAKITLKSVMRQ
jgi:hypothetical protein